MPIKRWTPTTFEHDAKCFLCFEGLWHLKRVHERIVKGG